MDATNALPAAFTALFAGSIFLFLLFLALGVGYFVFWLLSLVHCIKHRHDKDRLMWIMIIIFVPFFGALFYMTMGRQKVPPTMPNYVPHQPQGLTELPPLDPSCPPLDINAMQDEKKRAAAINESLSAMGKSGRQ